MAAPEETSASRYVKLGKEQDAPVEDIRPGELNQPVHVPQLVVHRCAECGQPLPESYEPPSNEPWTTGIFGCGQDMDSCELSCANNKSPLHPNMKIYVVLCPQADGLICALLMVGDSG
jgi:hypothetical protein